MKNNLLFIFFETSRSINIKLKDNHFYTIIKFLNTRNAMVAIFTVVSVLKRCTWIRNIKQTVQKSTI